jgi:murein DD-endopeptidase MepM/ murein hydrolase activator NlpD
VAVAVRPFTHAPLSSLKVTSSFGARGRVTTHPDGSQTVDAADVTFHGGLDLRAAVGTPIVAVDDAVVESIERAAGVGLILRIRLDGRRERVSYMHLADVVVQRGERVAGGSLLGHTGDGDGAVAPHLHLEVKPEGATSSVDPLPYLSSRVARVLRVGVGVVFGAVVGVAGWWLGRRFGGGR